MTVVSSQEFAIQHDKYLDMAATEQVYIQRRDCLFIVTKVNEPRRKYKEPDDDLRRAITMDEFLIGAKEDLREIFRKEKR